MLGYDPAPLFGGPEELSFEEVRLAKAAQAKLASKQAKQPQESVTRKFSETSTDNGLLHGLCDACDLSPKVVMLVSATAPSEASLT